MERVSPLSIPIDDEPTNVIVLSEVITRHRHDKCQHKRVQIDEIENEVECKDCGKRLNPMAILARLAREESRLKIRIEQLKELNAQLDAKKRTKCSHCGSMTNVRPGR